MKRNSADRTVTRRTPGVLKNLSPLLRLIAFMWLLELIDATLLRHQLDYLGIVPRTLPGVIGIALAPILHRDFYHLLANTVPLLIAGTLIILQNARTFRQVTVTVWLIAGLLEWTFAPSNISSIGASALVFGYIGFLLTRAIITFHIGHIVAALICAYLYGGTILPSVLPTKENLTRQISWHGHLFGLIAGIYAARTTKGTRA